MELNLHSAGGIIEIIYHLSTDLQEVEGFTETTNVQRTKSLLEPMVDLLPENVPQFRHVSGVLCLVFEARGCMIAAYRCGRMTLVFIVERLAFRKQELGMEIWINGSARRRNDLQSTLCRAA